ncbi:hypothetical protein [Nannocystis sp. SCPEA4]|uniref:hypothetical protein n=1 Tax=Nannocystis sp. SCPEA4 TaxID=2996787 RepID=UPI0022713C4E|nr:hypothetical protein [Nannocystis sp. SCPEA4]MCY1055300.1 hypothetical protein [Nannocystis sp. SCPEA4]
MKRLSMSLMSVFVAVATGCGIGPEIDDFNESAVAAASANCECPGLVSEEECREDTIPTAAEQACVEALLKNTEGDWEPHLTCRTAANNRLANCLSSRTCTDVARFTCGVDYADEVEDCPAFPADVQQELNECRT